MTEKLPVRDKGHADYWRNLESASPRQMKLK